MKSKNNWFNVTVALILVSFAVCCIATSLYYGDKLLLGDLTLFDNDDVKYLRSAHNLLSTGILSYNYPGVPTVFIMPGIVYLLAPFVWIFGMHGAIMPFRIFQVFLQTGALFMFFLVARRMFNEKVALITLLTMAIYVSNIYAPVVILTETSFMLMFSCLLYFIVRAFEEKKSKYYVIGGIFWGACAMFRPAIAAFPVVVLIMWLVRRYKLSEIVKYTLCAVIPFCVVMSPWWIRNAITFQRFIPFTLSSGNPALQGVFYDQVPDEEVLSKIDRTDVRYADDELVNNQTESLLAKRVAAYLFKQDPLKYIYHSTVLKTIANFRSPFIWFPLYGFEYSQLFLLHYVILVLGCLGFFALWRNPHFWLVFGTLLYFNCVHLAFYCFPRYLVPAMPLMIMSGAYLIFQAFQMFRKVLK